MSADKTEAPRIKELANSPEFDLFNMKMLSVFEIIRWLKGAATFNQVVELAATKQIMRSEVESILDILLKKKYIKKKDACFLHLTDTIFTDDHEGDTQGKMYKMFSDFRKLHIRTKPKEH